MRYRIGIDIGGTFTDLVFLAADGTLVVAKVPSTPDDFSRGIADGIAATFAAHGFAGNAIDEVIHGTTVATNAILEKTGARTGLLTTEGFRDVLEIRRLRMPALYDLAWQKPAALVDRARRLEVAERIDHRGEIERPLDEAQAAAAIERLLAMEVDVIAVCLLNAYANGVHERRLRELIRARDDTIPICLSSEILPEIKEYERTSTTVVNAYILPVVARYLRRLADVLRTLDVAAPVLVMQSNGGAMGVDAACERPIHIIESGPAAGVVGAAELAGKLGRRDVLTFDMGGTTAKAAMVEAGRFGRVGSLDVGGGINLAGRLLTGGGYHVRVPAIDIAEVGAGGGSLVRLDPGGLLKVGPESAGADPGPVCYDRGATVPTVTDANVVLGFLNPEFLIGGALRLDRDKAERAIADRIAQPLDLSVEAAAYGIHTIANASMARALRAVSTERGRDPRGFTLMAFGGSGPVHAATLARSLDIPTILVPPVSGVFSALGLLFPETEHHYVRTFKRTLDRLDLDEIEAVFTALEQEGIQALESEGYPAAACRTERLVDMRYFGENSELALPVAGMADFVAAMNQAFDREHERAYGYRSEDEVVELVNLRVIAKGISDSARVPDRLRFARETAPSGTARDREAYFGPDVGWFTTPVIGRAEIDGDGAPGPVIVEEYDCTTVVPPGCRIRREDWDSLVIDVAIA